MCSKALTTVDVDKGPHASRSPEEDLSERSSREVLNTSRSLSCTQKGIQSWRYALVHACEVCAVSMRLASPAKPNL